MTDLELMYLFNEFFNTTYARLNDYLVGLFGMLVVAHFVAPKLNRMMAGLIIGLYSIFSIATIIPTIAVADRFGLTARQLRIAAEAPDSALSDIIGTLPSREIVTPFMAVLLVTAYVTSIVFFLQARKGKIAS